MKYFIRICGYLSLNVLHVAAIVTSKGKLNKQQYLQNLQ